jgi:ADP-heptose:LPS heptosyltransferase
MQAGDANGLLRAGANATMTRTLVIQLGRLGDIIQTTPLLADLAAGGDEVEVLVLRSTHEPLLESSAVSHIITIRDSLKSLDDAIACGFPNGKIPVEAHELLADLELPGYDRIINASHAPLGCWLAGEIAVTNSDARYGGIIRDCECLYLGYASVYRIALLQFREQNLFNVVDLLRGAHGAAAPVGRPCLYASRSADLPFALPHGRRVALNPGASDAVRRWPAENFARLAEALYGAGFAPILVGAFSDHELGEQIRSICRVPISNFAGRTTVPEMAALLARCDLLVSGDTGAAHLAAATGATVLGIYGATAWFAETAPYGDNHLILQAPFNGAMATVSMDAVLAAAMNRLGRFSATELRRELHKQKQSAWETSVQSPSRTSDPLGGLTYRPLHRDAFTPDEVFARSLRGAFAAEFVASDSGEGTTKSRCTAMQRNEDAVVEVFTCMREVARFCAESAGRRAASAQVATAASALMTTMGKLRARAAEPEWRRLSSVIHNLDWGLRMLPEQGAEMTFRAHAEAYEAAARILRGAGSHRVGF